MDEPKPDSRERWRAERQAGKYASLLRLGVVPKRGDQDTAAQSRNYAKSASEMQFVQRQTKQVLMGHGVLPSGFVGYMRFALFLWKRSKAGRGDEFMFEAQAAVARWTGQGLPREILLDVLAQVFNTKLAIASEPKPGVELDGHRE